MGASALAGELYVADRCASDSAADPVIGVAKGPRIAVGMAYLAESMASTAQKSLAGGAEGSTLASYMLATRGRHGRRAKAVWSLDWWFAAAEGLGAIHDGIGHAKMVLSAVGWATLNNPFFSIYRLCKIKKAKE